MQEDLTRAKKELEETEFSSGRQASLWLGLNEDTVSKAIKNGHLLKDKQFKAYRK